MSKKVLIVVDMQEDFVTGPLGTPEAQQIVPIIKEKIKKLKSEKGNFLIFTQDTHFEDYLETQEGKNLPVPHCVVGTNGISIVPELKEFAIANIFQKISFGSIDLAMCIGEMFESGDIDEVELCGVCTDICVVSNALLIKSICPEIPIIVDVDACAGVTPAAHMSALDTLRSCQVKVIGGNINE